MTQAVTSTPAPERMRVEVTLIVTHSVAVKVDATSAQTIDQLKEAALGEFHRGAGNRVAAERDKDWRFQFANRSNISVGAEQVTIGNLRTVKADY